MKRKTNADQVPMFGAPSAQPTADNAVASGQDDVRKALRSLLAAFRTGYFWPDGIRRVPPPVYDFLDGIRSMVQATSLAQYVGKPGVMSATEARTKTRERLGELLALCKAQTSPSPRLQTGHERALAALAALETSS